MGNTLVPTVFFLPAALLAPFLHLLQAGIPSSHTAQRPEAKLHQQTPQQLNQSNLGCLGAGKSGDFKQQVPNEEAETL